MKQKTSKLFETVEFADFTAEVHTLLQSEPDAVSEYQLLDKLKKTSRYSFVNTVFDSNLSLFHSHFILFHCLYRLRKHLLQQELAILEISALSIKMHDFTETGLRNDKALAQPDLLQNYYLEGNNIDSTDEEDLSNMIDSFWHKLIANDARPQALKTLGLSDPVNDTEIKQTWRQLVMKHHPDRGGDADALLSVNKAFSVLIT